MIKNNKQHNLWKECNRLIFELHNHLFAKNHKSSSNDALEQILSRCWHQKRLVLYAKTYARSSAMKVCNGGERNQNLLISITLTRSTGCLIDFLLLADKINHSFTHLIMCIHSSIKESWMSAKASFVFDETIYPSFADDEKNTNLLFIQLVYWSGLKPHHCYEWC